MASRVSIAAWVPRPDGCPGRGLGWLGAFRRWVLITMLVLGAVRGGASSLTSSLPGFFTPGVPITVAVQAVPDSGIHVYAVEEAPPTNWVVSAISHGGVFDSATGRVKWGPFGDATARVLSYQVVPPPAAAGTNAFTGVARFDGSLVPVTGIRSTAKFPGTLVRTAPADYLPGVAATVMLAATPAADVGAWAVEESVPAGWTVSGVSAGGELDAANHRVKWGPFFDATARSLVYTLASPADSRADVALAALARFGAATLTDSVPLPLRASRLTRDVPATYLPGVAFTVSLTAEPAPFVQTLVLEEAVADGWTPANISHGGVWDSANRKLKWGPLLGAAVTETAFSYRLTPSAGMSQPLLLGAAARFDERTVTSSATVTRFLVHSENSVVRSLPASYRPGQVLTVTLEATPVDTGLIYAVEESVPVGWSVEEASHGGVLDAVNRRVKWGPFFDALATPRTLTYRATPPADAFGTVNFLGSARFDAAAVAVTGAASLANAPGTVTRTLPARYLPGTPLVVTLTATPVPGVETYAVVEEVPAGWTVGGFSDGGAYDSINHQLKWGPFLDRDLRPLTYTVTPPVGATGTNRFAGHGWFNGVASETGGDSQFGLNHVPLAIPNSLGRRADSSVKVSVFKLLANDSDPDDDFLAVTGVSAISEHGADVQLDWPWIFYTPPDGFNATDTFTYTVGDGFGATATATVTVTVDSAGADPAQNIVALDELPDGHVRVRFTGVPGFTYHVEISSDATNWSRVADRLAGAVGQFEFEDAAPVSPRFYRSTWP